MNAVTCMTWVKRGAAKQHPDKVKLTAAELKELIKSQEDKLRKLGIEDVSDEEEDAEEGGATASKVGGKRKHDEKKNKTDESVKKEKPKSQKNKDFNDIVNKYSLDDYDDEDDEEDEDNRLNVDNIAFYSSMAEDPYIKGEDSEDEIEILEDDNVLAIGRVKGEYCILEAHVYNEKESNLFCHHDILLPTFPLALEWIDYDPGEPGTKANLVAMGTMEPDIEIWDLDVIDSLEPAYVLQGVSKKSSKKKKKVSMLGHCDAVLALAWNQLQRKVLASASADFTIGLWDLEEGKMVTSITEHTEKVQALQWHPVEAQSLLSGSFDQTVKVYDCRSPSDSYKSWTLDGEVERVLWNHHSPYYFLASTDKGAVFLCDVRQDEVLFKHEAHNAAITGLCLSSSISNCLVTTSADKMLKVWDLQLDKLIPVMQKNMKMGELHSAAMSPDSGLVIGVGGETDFRIVNLRRNEYVTKHFALKTDTAAVGGEEIPLDAGADTDEEENAIESKKTTKGVPQVIKKKPKKVSNNEPPKAANIEETVAKKKKKKNKKKPKVADS